MLRLRTNYPEYLMDDWAQWLKENYFAELPELRPLVFQNIIMLIFSLHPQVFTID